MGKGRDPERVDLHEADIQATISIGDRYAVVASFDLPDCRENARRNTKMKRGC